MPYDAYQYYPKGYIMTDSITDQLVANNQLYASGNALHKSSHPGAQAIAPAKRVAVVACMDARLDVEDLLGIQTGDAHIIRRRCEIHPAA
jgi:carbonic anhydrase